MEIRFPLILDGATGTELQKRGYMGDVQRRAVGARASRDAFWICKKAMLTSGSNVLYSPSFGANRQKA